MKIGITCYPVYGGSGVVATELGIALARRGHEIHFISYALPFRLGHLAQNIYFHEVPVNAYPLFEYPPYSLTLTSKMTDIVQHEKLDLLHVHYAIPHATSAVLARQILEQQGLYIPVVTTLHGTDITIVGRDPSFAPVVNYSINESDGVTAVSSYLRDETLRHFKVQNDIAVIPNFIDTKRFRRVDSERLRQELCPNCEKILIHVSNFRPVKHAPLVVRVLHELRQRGHGLKLLMVGDGPDRVAAEHQARVLGVQQDVRFLGKQEAVEEVLSVADVFLMPSASETFGLAALEAMACGVPVVASRIGGLPELITDGETGFLCPPDDPNAFANRTEQLITDEALHARISAAGLARAIDEFDVDRIIPLYEAYYEQTLQQAATHPIHAPA
jgi:N-acetyl-alpha-D-glucosaminyl L-malate synthase BshA